MTAVGDGDIIQTARPTSKIRCAPMTESAESGVPGVAAVRVVAQTSPRSVWGRRSGRLRLLYFAARRRVKQVGGRGPRPLLAFPPSKQASKRAWATPAHCGGAGERECRRTPSFVTMRIEAPRI